MDQMACAVGGCVAIDFENPATPQVEPMAFSPERHGYALVIVDSGADHADLTEEYAAIPQEMALAASVFGQTVLRGIGADSLFAQADEVRRTAGDGAFACAAFC